MQNAAGSHQFTGSHKLANSGLDLFNDKRQVLSTATTHMEAGTVFQKNRDVKGPPKLPLEVQGCSEPRSMLGPGMSHQVKT